MWINIWRRGFLVILQQMLPKRFKAKFGVVRRFHDQLKVNFLLEALPDTVTATQDGFSSVVHACEYTQLANL